MSSKPKANPTTDSSVLKLNVIVVGAGIGGMAAATALGRRGHNVTVFEDAPQIGEVRYLRLYTDHRLAPVSKYLPTCHG
jgi:cation diffusion facilitator CzcD-associated flavoprotein CzcO